MERWARYYTDKVCFLCVCVDGQAQRVATWFHHQFDFTLVVNAFIPSSRYMPRGFGQLGCSGFVVSDGNGNFVSRKTKAYLDYGEDAFDHVDGILAGILKKNGIIANGNQVPSAETVRSSPTVADYSAVPSLGIESMDHEHESCNQALQQLLQDPTKKNLQVVYQELVQHFAHEEALMVQHGFGGTPGDPFSPLTSHVKDHQRILSMIEKELNVGANAGGAGNACSTSNGVVT